MKEHAQTVEDLNESAVFSSLQSLERKVSSELLAPVNLTKRFIQNQSKVIEEKSKLVAEKSKLVAEKSKLAEDRAKQIELLIEELKLARARQFGPKSEKQTTDDIQGRLFDEAALSDDEAPAVSKEEETITVPAHERKTKGCGRKPLPENLERIIQEHDLSASEKVCACGCELTCIGEETSEQLDYIPAKVQVIRHICKKYACRGCEDTIKTAKKPKQPIAKSIATPGLLSYVCVSKFEDYLPLYRQERLFNRIGIDLPRSSLSNWVLKCADLLLPLYKLLQSRIAEYDIASSDETTVQVLKEKDKPAQAKSYMWVLSGGPPQERSFLYHYARGRSHQVIEDFMDGFKGYLHCDGYRGYEAYAKKSGNDIQLVGCWYHVRRKFVEAEKVGAKGGLATDAIKVIKKLSKLEDKIKKLTPIGIKSKRQKEAKLILKKFHGWLTTHAPKVPPQSVLGKAFSYTLNQWPKLQVYLEDGRLSFSNNHMERAVKPFVMGRKNWLFMNTPKGADAAAIIYSMIETAKVHDVKAYPYLKYVFEKIPTANTLKELEALLPFYVDRSQLDA
jgi:transposase